MKKVLGIYSNPRTHWVGNGFPVRSLFSYHSHGQQLSPFLLLDRAGPQDFEPTDTQRGVGQHPHRGFETVTLVYQGEVSHRDSTGKGGTIGPGDVQWMTAGAGILHEEFHSDKFAQAGGVLDMVQLWVNLPSSHKMTSPGYQAILSRDIPVMKLPDGAGQLRVIAGEYEQAKGPAHTFSPMNVWDLQLNANAEVAVPAHEGWNTALIVLRGNVRVNGEHAAREGQLVVLDARGSDVNVDAESDALVLLLSGVPLREPIVGHGPFVMNTSAEIERAMLDFNSGQFGRMPS